jgi:hypothetical protein
MEYKSKLYIIENYKRLKLSKENPKYYAKVIATFDMSEFNFGNIFKKKTNCYIYADDGNTEILEDTYGEPLKESNFEKVINYLENYRNTEEHYKRVMPLLGLLKGFDIGEWDNLTILRYGH